MATSALPSAALPPAAAGPAAAAAAVGAKRGGRGAEEVHVGAAATEALAVAGAAPARRTRTALTRSHAHSHSHSHAAGDGDDTTQASPAQRTAPAGAMDMDTQMWSPATATARGTSEAMDVDTSAAVAHVAAAAGRLVASSHAQPQQQQQYAQQQPCIQQQQQHILQQQQQQQCAQQQQCIQQQQQQTEAASALTTAQPAACEASAAAGFLRSRLLCAAGTADALATSGGGGSDAVGPLAMPLRPSLAAAHDELVSVVGRVIREDGCTASVLLLGERGVGKTLLVERALATLRAVHASNAPRQQQPLTASSTPGVPDEPPFGVVRLSGLLHTDERQAFQEAARQLCGAFNQGFAKSASYDENLNFLRNMLQALHRCLKSVVFVIDEFDAFTRKGKQVLLYNLLDTLAHSRVQACVIGISAMQDVMDHMEKRVKSRFLARRIVLLAPQAFDAGPAPAAAGPCQVSGQGVTGSEVAAGVPEQETPCGVLSAMLSLPTALCAADSGSTAAGGAAAAAPPQPQPHGGKRTGGAAAPAERPLSDPAALRLPAAFVVSHNMAVTAALSDVSVRRALRAAFALRLTPADLSNVAQLSLAEWLAAALQQPTLQQPSLQQPSQQQWQLLRPCHVATALSRHAGCCCGSQAAAVADCSDLQLFLVVAFVRLAAKGHAVANFETAFEEYRSIQGGAPGDAFRWGRAAALRAFELLAGAGIVVFVGGGSGRRLSRGAAYAAVELRAGRSTVDAALRARGGSCPDLLLRFLRGEV